MLWLGKHETKIVTLLGCVLVLRFWISPLGSSFWADETGTVWAISGSFQDVLRHLRLDVFPQMPLFILLMWAWSQITGISEIALRLPSVIAVSLTAFLLVRMASRVTDKKIAVYSILLLASLSHVAFAASDARAYALALLAVTWGFFERLRWLETHQMRHLILHGIAWGIALNLNYFTGAALIADAAYLLVAHRHHWARFRPIVFVSPVITAALVAHLVPTLLAVMAQKGLHLVAGAPSWTDLGLLFTPPRWIIAGVLASGATLFVMPKRVALLKQIPVETITLFALWAVVPPVVLLGYSLISGASVMLPRYLLAQAPGMVLVGVWFLSRFEPPLWRLSTAFTLFAISILTSGRQLWTQHSGDDWRGASSVINILREQDPSVPVLMASPFFESARLPLPVSREIEEVLLAPLTAYPVSGSVTMLPIEIEPLSENYTQFIPTATASQNRFVMVLQNPSRWTRGRLDADFSTTELYADPLILLLVRRPESRRDQP